MAIKDALLPEWDQEMATTRRCLERVPEDKLAWKPHEKSMTLGRLASHLAEMPVWASATLDAPELDMAPPGQPPMEAADFKSRQQILDFFDKTSAAARASLEKATDENLMSNWTLKKGGKALMTLPKIVCLRSFVMNHSIHHRGQITVYLRLNDAPVPSVYGPSADEGQMFG